MEGVSTERMIRRRSLRIVMRVPLYVSPANAPATAEWEPVETLVVSLHGGMIRSRQQFAVGTTLDIRMRNTQRFTRGRVVWTAAAGRDHAYEVGFEILDPPGFWEIKFPEDRWSEGEHPLSIGAERGAGSPPAPKYLPMLVRDAMTTHVTTLRADDMLLDAMRIFARAAFRHLPILNAKHLVGMVRESDLKHYTASIPSGISPEERNRLMETTPLSQIMTRDLITIEPSKTIYEAAQMLYDRRLECLPVVEDGEFKGIITTTEMLNLLLQLLKEKGLVPPGHAN
jgi:CBS domain-containing protein